MDDCCGGGGPAWPGPAPTVWPAENYTGTTTPLPGVDTPSMQWADMADASTILDGAPAFTPPDNPALVTLVEIRNRRERLHHGFPNGCFRTPANCHQAFNLQVVENWRYHAKMLEMSYLEEPTIGEYLQTFCPCLITGQWIPNSADEFLPGTMIAHTATHTIVYISGTNTFQQFAFQGAYSLAGPSTGDGYGTNSFWYQQFTRLVARIIASGIGLRENWFIAGHSYGGALASILAAVVQRAVPSRKVTLFTIGCPAPGDERLSNLLADIDQVNLMNAGDPVCSIPPNNQDLDAVAWLISAPLRAQWGRWYPPHRRVSIDTFGSYRPSNAMDISFVALTTLAELLDGGLPIPPAEVHQASVYYARASIIHD